MTEVQRSDLVLEDASLGTFRVARDAYTSPELFELERERVFESAWVYVAHDSELPSAGDFVRRDAAGRSVVVTRTDDGRLHGMLNTCPHRGAAVCRLDDGHAKTFQCFYHAWTFSNDGSLLTRPDEDGYGAACGKETLGLTHVRIESYQGFVFVNLSGTAAPLREFLGDAAYYLDLIAEQAPSGMRVLPGCQRYEISANWKLFAENSVDGYHTIPLHPTYFAYAAKTGARKAKGTGPGYGRNLGNGHGVMAACSHYGRPGSRWVEMFGSEAKSEIEQARSWMFETHPHHKAFEMAEVTRNLWIFPNLVVNDGVAITVRKIDPVGAGRTVVTAWAMGAASESSLLTRTRLSSFLTFYGPGGFAHPDDIEAIESCQRGFANREVRYSDFSRGMGGATVSLTSNVDEAQLRAFWREWAARMEGLPSPAQTEAREPCDLDELERRHLAVSAEAANR